MSETNRKDALYKVSKWFVGTGCQKIVQFSCEMPYPGWCRLQKSEQWAAFLVALADAQKESGGEIGGEQ